MTGELIDYSASEARTEQGVRMLNIYANEPKGLLTVSRLSAVIAGSESEQALVQTAVHCLVTGEEPNFTVLEVLNLGQIMDKVEQFCDKIGGFAIIGAVVTSAPQELKLALSASEFLIEPIEEDDIDADL